MAENSYAGYVKRPTPINWGEVASGVVNRMEDTEKKHEAFRTKYDAMAGELRKEVDKFVETSGLNPELDKKVSEATQMAKGLIFDMHNKLKRREINPSAMNNLQHSLSSEWSDFNTVVKNIDQSLVAAMEGVNEGENGDGTLYAVEKYGELMDLKHQNIVFDVDESGFAGLYMQKIDDNGDPVDNGLTSVRTLKNPNNLIFRNVKLTEKVKDFFDDQVGKYVQKTEDGQYIDDPTKKPGYDAEVKRFVDDLLSDEKQVLSILADYDGYEIYTDGETPPAGKSVAMKIGPNGEFVPLVDDLKDEAKKIIMDKIALAAPSIYKEAPKDDLTPSQYDDIVKEKREVKRSVQIASGDTTAINQVVNDYDSISKIEVVQKGPKEKLGITIYDKNGKPELIKWKKGTLDDSDNWDPATDGDLTKANIELTARDVLKYISGKKGEALNTLYKARIGDVDTPDSVVKFTGKGKTFAAIDKDKTKEWRGNVYKNIEDGRGISQTTNPNKIEEYFEKYLDMPGVKVGNISEGDDTIKITVGSQTFSVPRRGKTGGSWKRNYRDIESDINTQMQKIIDYYYSELGMEQPQEQQMDLTQTGAKYNVA